MSEDQWQLTRKCPSASGRIAYDVFGQGPAVVLVHGTPSWSYLWRHVVPRLAGDFTVYVYDLPGYGTSEKRADQDLSLPAQARVLTDLLDAWGVDQPCIAGHDIGGAITLRAALADQRRFHRMALCDAVAIAPWITPFSRHVQAHLDAFQGVPEHIHRHMVAAHLQSAIERPMSDDDLALYLAPWLGSEGQAAYYRQLAQLDEAHTREIEAHYGDLRTPTMVLWGDHDGWLTPEIGRQLANSIPGSRWAAIPGAGHFVQEDQHASVAEHLAEFFGESPGGPGGGQQAV